MKPLLEVKNLHLDFINKKKAVFDINFTLEKGEKIALIGASGSGKSVTAKALTRLLPQKSVHIQGQVLLEGKDLLACSEKEIRFVRGKEIGMIFQDPNSSLHPSLPIGLQIFESYQKAHPQVRYKEALGKIIELLQWVGIDNAKERVCQYPHTLSGGMRQRIMIAIALACEPKILIADEPTTALDVTIQAQILSLLQEIQTTLGMGLLLITHDLQIATGFCDKALVMHEGTLVDSFPTTQIQSHIKHPQTLKLLEAKLPQKPTQNLSHIPFVHIQNLTKKFENTLALDNISLTLYEKETLALIGESSSGKSTLGKILIDLETATSGTIAFQKSIPPNMQIVFQNPTSSLNPKMTITQILQEPFSIQKKPISQEIIDTLLKQVGLNPDIKNLFAHQLSGGQCQRVSIARALSLEPKILIADEPVSALDSHTLTEIITLLKNLQQTLGLTLLFISHDLQAVQYLADRIAVLYLGQLMELSPAQELYKQPLHPYTQALFSASFFLPQPLSSSSKEEKKIGKGCAFAGRCPHAQPLCHEVKPQWKEVLPQRFVSCHFAKNNFP